MKREALAALLALLPAVARSSPPAIIAHRSEAPITIDGALEDPGWKAASRFDGFVETAPADNAPPPVRTEVIAAYDGRFLYVAVVCLDPDPDAIRAPYVDRDAIADTDDSVTILLDTRGDRRSAMEFRVNPRGQQADGVFDDANLAEDHSPDFFWEAAARVAPPGWTAELRIPFSSLRYSGSTAENWGILVRRNYPRSFRHELASAPIPRNSNCVVCRSQPLSGIAALPSAGHVVAAPYVALSEQGRPAGDSFRNAPVRGSAGIDVKWTPSPGTAVDAAVNPDFSQVEADVGQISANSRFALFFPEKRPFFLEGSDLFQTPFAVVSTRTITSPRWGLRGTGRWGDTGYTLLVAQDRGGGSVVIPGPAGSDVAPQPGSSIVAIGRARTSLGASFAGVALTDREGAAQDGGGYNRVLGGDFQWRPAPFDAITGQLLVSDTRAPDRPDLFASWDARRFASRAFTLQWSRNDPRWHLRALYEDVGDGFRADAGFMPQVGFRHEKVVAAYDAYDLGPLTRLRSGVYCDYFSRAGGDLLQRNCGFYVAPTGVRNLGGEIDLTIAEKDRVAGRVVDSRLVLTVYGLSIDPGKVLSRITLGGYLGDSPDFVNGRPGNGGDVSLTATVRPTLHLQIDANAEIQWLDVDSGGAPRRLFTADVARVKATCNFTARAFARVIGQRETVRRDPSLYATAVKAREERFSGSALLGYRVNWQTVAFLGYGDERARTSGGDLAPDARALFLKISYAWQR